MPSVTIVSTREEAEALLREKFSNYCRAAGFVPGAYSERYFDFWLAGLVMGLDQRENDTRCFLGSVAVGLISHGKRTDWKG